MGLDLRTTLTNTKMGWSYGGVQYARVLMLLAFAIRMEMPDIKAHPERIQEVFDLLDLREWAKFNPPTTPLAFYQWMQKRPEQIKLLPDYTQFPERYNHDFKPWPKGHYDETYGWKFPLHEYDGALAGLYKVVNHSDADGYHSPGDVRDITVMFNFIEGALALLLPDEQEVLRDWQQYFNFAALRGEGIRYS